MPLILKRSLPEQVEEETKWELANLCSYGKWHYDTATGENMTQTNTVHSCIS